MNVTIRFESLAAALADGHSVAVSFGRAGPGRGNPSRRAENPGGDFRQRVCDLQLEAIVCVPDDRLPHPLAVLNHDRLASLNFVPPFRLYGMWAQAFTFARVRGGFTVAFIMPPRYWPFPRADGSRDYGSCANPDYQRPC